MTDSPSLEKHTISRRTFLKAGCGVVASGPLLAGGGLVYTSQVEINWLKTERVLLTLPNLPSAFDGYRVVQISDLHIEEPNSQQNAQRAVERALDLAPDAILITGDFVSGRVQQALITNILSPLTAPDGVWATMGNHDHWTDATAVRDAITAAGINELRNANTPIQRGDSTLWLAGVDDIWEQHHDLNRALDSIPEGQSVILLAHEPDFADDVAPTNRVSLQLSGHSHGGQIRLPLIGSPVLPYLGQKYPIGLRKLGEMWLYTNRGVGYVSPAVRFNCRPEITEFTLRSI